MLTGNAGEAEDLAPAVVPDIAREGDVQVFIQGFPDTGALTLAPCTHQGIVFACGVIIGVLSRNFLSWPPHIAVVARPSLVCARGFGFLSGSTQQ